MLGQRKSTYVLRLAGACLCALGIVLVQGCSSEDEKAEEPQSRLMKVTFSVPEMDCTVCSMKIKTALEMFGGVEKAYASFLEKEAWARYDPLMVDAERMRKAILNLGFKEVIIVSDEPYVPEPLPDEG